MKQFDIVGERELPEYPSISPARRKTDDQHDQEGNQEQAAYPEDRRNREPARIDWSLRRPCRLWRGGGIHHSGKIIPSSARQPSHTRSPGANVLSSPRGAGT